MDKTDRLLKTLKAQAPIVQPIATEMILPNHSGMASHKEFVHANLGLLTADDHPQYAEIADTETITGTWTWGTTTKIQWRDTGLYIYSSVDGQLDIVADTLLQLGAVGDITLGDGTLRTMYPATTEKIDLGKTANMFNETHTATLLLKDGVTAPGAISGQAYLYIDSADGDLKIKFGDGTVKTIATDT